MTPQEISDYKQQWLKDCFHVRLHSDLVDQGKTWCRRTLERHQWSMSKWTDVYEHTFYFEYQVDANAFKDHFKEWVDK